MKNLKQKLSRQEGFTLIEMLIVVAIIAILIAISIPVVNNALEKAKHATDAANERAAKAAIIVKSLNDSYVADTVECYNAVTGDFTGSTAAYGKHGAHKNMKLYVKIGSDNNVYMEWASSTPADLTALSPAGDGSLCSQTVH